MLGLSREMGRNEDYYSPTYKPKHGHEKKLGFSSYLVIFAISFGVLLVLLNAYQLYNLSRRTFGDSPQVQQAKKVVWLYAKKVRLATNSRLTLSLSRQAKIFSKLVIKTLQKSVKLFLIDKRRI